MFQLALVIKQIIIKIYDNFSYTLNLKIKFCMIIVETLTYVKKGITFSFYTICIV
jgi:hypothetical protein